MIFSVQKFDFRTKARKSGINKLDNCSTSATVLLFDINLARYGYSRRPYQKRNGEPG